MLYTETDLEESMEKIETINFHEVREVAGIKFWCYHAGHVLGAAMFMIEIAGVKVRPSNQDVEGATISLYLVTEQSVFVWVCVAAVHRRLFPSGGPSLNGCGDSQCQT